MLTPSPQVYARLGGALYLVIFALGFTAFAFPSFSTDPHAAQVVIASLSRLRIYEALELVYFSVDIPLALIFYVLLRPVDDNIALLAAFFRIANAFFGSVSVLGRLVVLTIYGNAALLASLTAQQASAMSIAWLSWHSDAQQIGIGFFGVHCILLGVLIYRSAYLPKFLGVLLPIAGVLYVVNALTAIVAPPAADHLVLLVFPIGFVSEASLCVWLLIKGVDSRGYRYRVEARAQSAMGIAP